MAEQLNPITSENEFGRPSLPSGLNVLTILTIIGSVFQFGSAIFGFINSKKTYEGMKKAIDGADMENIPSWARSSMNADTLHMYLKMHENRLPILVLTLLASGLCLWGAIEMRKMRKQGFTYYLVGELLPLATTFLFVGIGAFSGLGLLALLIPAVFITLYLVNKKNLVY